MSQERVKFCMESKSHNEQFARVVTAVFAARLDPTLEELNDVKTAVSEAVTNAIIHGYEELDGNIELELIADEEECKLTVIVRDFGCGIADIEQAREPFFTTKSVGERSGMGFSFMEAFMDTVEVASVPGSGTVITMTKRMGITCD